MSIVTRRLGVRITILVACVVLAVQMVIVSISAVRWHSSIIAEAETDANGALDYLRAIHTQAMLNRANKADGDPVIDTLDGTMDQLSEEAKNLTVWLVQGPKVVAFQKSQGGEFEAPRDAVDEEAVRTGKQVTRMLDNGHFRLSRPVILGEGVARHEKCATCHGRDMGIVKGEVMGLFAV
ncbi:MAG: hypothetical protein EPN20_18895, partial [Magnetospirillum sp.]